MNTEAILRARTEAPPRGRVSDLLSAEIRPEPTNREPPNDPPFEVRVMTSPEPIRPRVFPGL
jgi:hypothetical protein